MSDLFAQGIGLPNLQKKSGDDGTNSSTTIDVVLKGTGKGAETVAKLAGMPLDLSALGETSIFQPFESLEQFIERKPPGLASLDMRGGVIAKVLHDIFIKNREMVDHTQGITGGQNIEAMPDNGFTPSFIPSQGAMVGNDIGGP